MNRFYCCVAAWTLLLMPVQEARSALMISVGDFDGVPGGTVDIPITISGPDIFQNVSLSFSVGDGGAALGGTDTIEISAVDFISGPTVWDGFSLITSFGVSLPAASATIANVGISTASTDTTTANSLLMTITLDLLSIDNSQIGDTFALGLNASGLTAVTASSGAALVPSLSPGTLTIVAVPEPSQVLMMSLATAAVSIGYYWKRRCQVVC